MSKTITIIGAGYVGLSTAALLSNCGHTVHLIDLDKQRIDTIASGKSFFFEHGIDPLIKQAVDMGSLVPSSDYSIGIPKSSVIFSCVGTPDNPDGSSNLSYVFSAAKEAAKYMKPDTVYVQKSTVPVGTGSRIEALFKDLKKDIIYLSNPEFLREGTAISDTLWFDRIVVGGEDKLAIQLVIDLYKTIGEHREAIATIADLSGPANHAGAYISTNRNSAELIKVTANAFLALKISFANSIAKLADETGADINEVMDAVGADRRIGRAFLNAGRGYGGGCFPKDVSGLISSATKHGVDLGIMSAASDLNETMPGYIANKAQKLLGSLDGKNVAVLGLAFKAGTSDARKSPGVKLANILDKNGAKVSAYDPEANNEAKEDLRKQVKVCESLENCVKNTDAVLVTTDWAELKQINLTKLKELMTGVLFVDAMNCFDRDAITSHGFTYIGVGRN